MQARRGELVDVLEGSGIIAEVEGRGVGLVTWSISPGETGGDGGHLGAVDRSTAEIRALAVADAARHRGVGRALLGAAEDGLRAAGVRRAWLVTTNDNLFALALYQQSGWRLSALRAGAVDELRSRVKSSIGLTGQHGIPLRDELELAKAL